MSSYLPQKTFVVYTMQMSPGPGLLKKKFKCNTFKKRCSDAH